MIRLGRYGIKAMPECWEFGVVSWDEETGDYISDPTYPTTLGRALELYIRAALRDSNPSSLGEVRHTLREIEETIADSSRLSEVVLGAARMAS